MLGEGILGIRADLVVSGYCSAADNLGYVMSFSTLEGVQK